MIWARGFCFLEEEWNRLSRGWKDTKEKQHRMSVSWCCMISNMWCYYHSAWCWLKMKQCHCQLSLKTLGVIVALRRISQWDLLKWLTLLWSRPHARFEEWLDLIVWSRNKAMLSPRSIIMGVCLSSLYTTTV